MQSKFKGIKVSALSVAVPSKVVEVASFGEKFGESEISRIISRTGIERFRKSSESMTAADLCFAAAESLIEKEKIGKDEIDVLVFVSTTPDYISNATSIILQDRLGLRKEVACFDLTHGCSGFIYGLFQACLVLNGSEARKVLVLVGESPTKLLSAEDRSTLVLFGDAGSAMIVEKSGTKELFFSVGSDGSGLQHIIYPSSGFRISTEDKFLRMQGADVLRFACEEVPKSISQVLHLANKKIEDLGLIFFHQANKMILELLTKLMKLPVGIAPVTLKNFGNTGSASIPLSIVLEKDKFSADSWKSVILCGFGIGLSWGACLLDLSELKIHPLVEMKE